MKLPLILIASLLVLAIDTASAVAQQGDRVALLIGNATYPDADATLKEPVGDAHALGDELRREGFDVDIEENLTKAAMRGALDRFYGKITSTSTAAIFFSGFGIQSGIQSGRQNYLIPIDPQIWNEGDLRRDGFSLDTILAEMTKRGARMKIAIVDAARRNPYERRFRSVASGLAPISIPQGTIVMSSAPSNIVISDDSPVFVSELTTELKVSSSSIEEAFNRTRTAVSRATNGQQVPSVSSSLVEDIALGPPVQPTVTPDNLSPPSNPAPAPEAPIVKSEEPTVKPDDKLNPAPAPKPVAEEKTVNEARATDSADQPSRSENETSNDPTFFYRQGQREAQNGDYLQAIKDFDEVIRRNPKHAGALNDRCWVRAIIGDLGNAMKDCDASLAIEPNYVDALDSRGLVELKVGLLSQAIADYDIALRIDPKHASALFGRGIAKRRNGNIAAGNSDIAAAKAIESTIAEEFVHYGIR
jgi:Caspase domain/Tetratricopeptide repeat